MLDNLRYDTRRLLETKSKPFPWYVLESLAFDNGYQAVVLHRIAHWFRRRRIPVVGPLVARLSLLLTGVEIGPGAEIGPGLHISHGVGLVVGGYVRMGSGATLLHGVTLGAPDRGRQTEMPTLGDDVFVGAGAKVIGAITVGDRVFVGVNAVVTRDVPEDTTVLVRDTTEMRPRREGEGGIERSAAPRERRSRRQAEGTGGAADP